jgi:hypothetical protein
MKSLRQYIKEAIDSISSSQTVQNDQEEEDATQDVVKSNNNTIKDLEKQNKAKKDTMSVKISNNEKINSLERQKKEEEVKQTQAQIDAVKKNNQKIVDLEAEKKKKQDAQDSLEDSI